MPVYRVIKETANRNYYSCSAGSEISLLSFVIDIHVSAYPIARIQRGLIFKLAN